MTIDSPKGPEREPAYEPGARDRVARWYRDRWGYHVKNETTLQHADDAMEAVRPEVERLTTEVVLFRERDGLTRKALQHDGDGPLQFAALVVRQERDRLRAEVSRLREQLATTREELRGIGHPGWPDPISFNWGANPHANAAGWLAQYQEQHPNISVQRRVVTEWEEFDPLRASAPSEATLECKEQAENLHSGTEIQGNLPAPDSEEWDPCECGGTCASSSPPSGGDSDTTPRMWAVGDRVHRPAWNWTGLVRAAIPDVNRYRVQWDHMLDKPLSEGSSMCTSEELTEAPSPSSLPQEGGTDGQA